MRRGDSFYPFVLPRPLAFILCLHAVAGASLLLRPARPPARREKLDYYRVEGNCVKKISANDWNTAEPTLALFNLQGDPCAGRPRIGSPCSTGLPSFAAAANGGGHACRKRTRAQIGRGQFSEDNRSRSKAWGAAATAAAEVIEVEDDDNDRDGGGNLPGGGGSGDGSGDGGGGVKADRTNGPRSRSSSGVSTGGRQTPNVGGRQDGTSPSGSGGGGRRESTSEGGSGGGGGGGEPKPRRTTPAVIDVEDGASEDECVADEPARVTATSGGGRSSARARAAGPEPPAGRVVAASAAAAAAAAAAATPARPKGSADDITGTGSSSGATAAAHQRCGREAAQGSVRIDELGQVRLLSSPANGSSRGPTMDRDQSPREAVGRSRSSSSSSGGGGGGGGSAAGRNPGSSSSSIADSSLASEIMIMSSSPSSRLRPSREQEARGDHEYLTAPGSRTGADDEEEEEEEDSGNEDVQVVPRSEQKRGRGDAGGGSSARPTPPPKTAAPSGSASRDVSGWMPRKRPSDSPLQRESGRADSDGAVAGRSLPGSSSSGVPELKVHDVDDDASPAAASPPTRPTPPISRPPPSPPPVAPAASHSKRHPSGVPMAFAGPASPPRAEGDAGFIGPPRPPQWEQPHASAPRPRQGPTGGGPWLKRNVKPATEAERREVKRKVAAAAAAKRQANAAAVAANRRGRSAAAGSGGGASGGAWRGGTDALKGSGGQTSITSWGEKGLPATRPSSYGGGGGGSGSGGGGGSSSFSSATSGKELEGRQLGKGLAALECVGVRSSDRRGSGSGSGRGGSSGSGSGDGRLGILRSRPEKVIEDLTGADDVWEEMGDGKGVVGGRSSNSMGGAHGDATLTTIRGINLQREHFDRIVDSDGWLTSQVRGDR